MTIFVMENVKFKQILQALAVCATGH